MIQNICEEKICLDIVKELSDVKKGRKALLFEICIGDYKCFAVYIKSDDEENLSVVSIDQNKAEEFFETAVKYELSPIHLSEFLCDFNREWEELCIK